MSADAGEVTLLLKAMRNGDESAAGKLLPLVYNELHRLAQSYMRRERPDHTVQATALINEAYLRLARESVDWQSRQHFIGVRQTLCVACLSITHERTTLTWEPEVCSALSWKKE